MCVVCLCVCVLLRKTNSLQLLHISISLQYIYVVEGREQPIMQVHRRNNVVCLT
jgi:hypothetical protein